MSSLTLFIDLCSHRKVIACVDGEKTLSLADIPDHTDEADLMPAIERLLSVSKTSLRKLGSVVAVAGPGGFMSQRVELSLSNTLAWSLKIPVAGVHLSEVWFARVPACQTPIPNPHSFLWLHSTQKKSLFIRGFGALSKEWPEATLIALEDAKMHIQKGTMFVGELIPEHADALGLKPMEILKSLEETLPLLCKNMQGCMPPILPWYGRGI